MRYHSYFRFLETYLANKVHQAAVLDQAASVALLNVLEIHLSYLQKLVVHRVLLNTLRVHRANQEINMA